MTEVLGKATPEGLRLKLAYDRKSASEQMREDEVAEKMGERIRINE
jgi:hypothetical protein